MNNSTEEHKLGARWGPGLLSLSCFDGSAEMRDWCTITVVVCGLGAILLVLIIIMGCMLYALMSTRQTVRELNAAERNKRSGFTGSNRNIAAEIKQLIGMRSDRCLTGGEDTRSIHSACSRHNLLHTSMPNLGVKVVEAKANKKARAAKADVHRARNEDMTPHVTLDRKYSSERQAPGSPEQAWRASLNHASDTLSIDTDDGSTNIYENPKLLKTSSLYTRSDNSQSPDVIPNFTPPPTPRQDEDDLNMEETNKPLISITKDKLDERQLMRSFTVPHSLGYRMKRRGPRVARKPGRKPVRTVPPFIPETAIKFDNQKDLKVKYSVINHLDIQTPALMKPPNSQQHEYHVTHETI